jgi:hypothetical protein
LAVSSRHARRRRAAAKRRHYELAVAEGAERRAIEQVVKRNLREVRSMTPEEAEAARIQRKADASFKRSMFDQPTSGRGSCPITWCSFAGVATVISG